MMDWRGWHASAKYMHNESIASGRLRLAKKGDDLRRGRESAKCWFAVFLTFCVCGLQHA